MHRRIWTAVALRFLIRYRGGKGYGIIAGQVLLGSFSYEAGPCNLSVPTTSRYHDHSLHGSHNASNSFDSSVPGAI